MHRPPPLSRRLAARPPRSRRAILAFAVSVMSAAACASPQADLASDSARAGAASPAAGTGAAGAGAAGAGAAGADGVPACPMEGDWTPCAVEERLTRAGVVLERQDDPVQHPFLSVPGTRYHVGNAEHELQVFLYPSADARARDTGALDSATVSPRGTRVAWRTPPTLVVSNNLAAIILSLNDRTVERLTLALAAGLPEPEKR